MKAQQQHQKLKPQPRPLFSCGLFGHCTESVLSPTNPHAPSLPDLSSTGQPPPPPPPPHPPQPPPPSPTPPPLPPPPPPHQPCSSSSSSSASTSQSFTQWRFPLPTSPIHSKCPPPDNDLLIIPSPPQPQPISFANLQELFHVAELQLSIGSESDQVAALHLLEHSLVRNPPSDPTCSPELMRGLVAYLKNKTGVKPATKVLLALCLAEPNRHVAVESGAVGAVVEVAPELEATAAERALAVLELMCTVPEGAAEIRTHALAVPVMVTMMGNMAGRGREYAISVLAVIYGGGNGGSGGDGGGVNHEEGMVHAPPEEVARAVVLALQGDCTARGRRKGAQLLKILQDYGRLDLTQDGK